MAISSYDNFDMREKRCCGFRVAAYAYFIAALELLISISGIGYSWYGSAYLKDYDSRVLFHDNLFLEARNHYYSESSSNVSLDWIHVDMYFYMLELMLTLVLVNGIITRNVGNVRIWLYVMLTYTLVVSGMFLGFIIGGISSSRLDVYGCLHAIFRFYQISVVYGFYESLQRNPVDDRRPSVSSISDLKESLSAVTITFEEKV